MIFSTTLEQHNSYNKEEKRIRRQQQQQQHVDGINNDDDDEDDDANRAAASYPFTNTMDMDTQDELQLKMFEKMREKILSFLVTYSMPLITPFSSSTLGLIETSMIKVHVLVFIDDDTPHSNVIKQGLKIIAKKYRGK